MIDVPGNRSPALVGSGQAVVAVITATAVGQALGYALTVFLANHLTPEAFATYVAAVAAFLLAGKLAAAGVDRLALRVLPSALASSDWSLLRGFFGFAARRAGIGIALVCLLALAIAAWFRPPVPITAIAVISGVNAAGVPITGLLAVAAWTLGWAVAAGLIAFALAKTLAPTIWRAAPRITAQEWRAAARPLWLYRGSTALMAQASLLALVWSGATAADVTAYVASVSTVALVLMLGNAANRLYARDLALVLDRQDSDGLARL